MCERKASGGKRISALIMGLMMLVIVLFSSFCIFVEADHDCTGDDCPVCACIQQCENTLSGISSDVLATASVMVPVLFVLLAAAFLVVAASFDTPVTRKVRLNN